jgi:HK97 gp10 family phage protein
MKVKLTGFENVQEVFRRMEQADKKKILISAYKKAVQPTYRTMKALTPKGKTHNLWNSIGISSFKRNEKVGVSIGARAFGPYKGYLGYIAEFGTVDRWAKTYKGKPLKTPRFTGKMPYKGFVRKAVQSTQNQVVNSVGQEWHNAIKRFIIRNK